MVCTHNQNNNNKSNESKKYPQQPFRSGVNSSFLPLQNACVANITQQAAPQDAPEFHYIRSRVLPIHLKIDAMQIELEAENQTEGVQSNQASVYIFSKLIGTQDSKLQGVLLYSTLLCNRDRTPARFVVGNLL